MRDLVIVAIHLIATIAKLLLPGGTRSVVSESLLLKRQLLISNRSRVRAPNLRPIDRIIASLLLAPADRSVTIQNDALLEKCEPLQKGLERPLIAAAAAALEPSDRWERPKEVCVRRKGTLAAVNLEATQSRDVGIRHGVSCTRESTSAAWSCNKHRTELVLHLARV